MQKNSIENVKIIENIDSFISLPSNKTSTPNQIILRYNIWQKNSAFDSTE